ncbi:MAG: hypothetical protein AAF497_24700, partial [Planctomycetota bacterium]
LNILGTFLGDANLDGAVDVSDFNLWNSNKFQPGVGWAQGDFNGDGVGDVSDFNIWNVNKFRIATRPTLGLALLESDDGMEHQDLRNDPIDEIWKSYV